MIELDSKGGEEMPYLGDIPRANGYTITITNASSNIGVTVFNMRTDRVSDVENIKLIKAADGSATTGPKSIGANIVRVVVIASVFNTTTATMSIGGVTISLAPTSTVTFDVV